MNKNKAYKFRIYPNNHQEVLINKTIGSSRFIWNKMLEDKNNHYLETKEFLSTTPAKYKKEYEFLKEVDSLALANVGLNLERAYKSFFRGTSNFPKYKKKRIRTIRSILII